MNKAFRIILIVLGVLVLAGGLLYAGGWIGRGSFGGFGSYRMTLVPALRFGASAGVGANVRPAQGNGYGMMGNGFGMMDGGRRAGPGMMNGYGNQNSSANPLTVEQAYQAAGKYLTSLINPDLKIVEVMVFDNNAYVRVVEKSTGIGAFELLVDPSTLSVYPEYGPNMMWNAKYAGLMSSNMMGGRGGMMDGGAYSTTPAPGSATMPVSSAQALKAAQQFLDKALPGSKTAADADPFYGYYTIDILKDGKITGMLSVNGYCSQVFLHTWHGTFIATQDY